MPKFALLPIIPAETEEKYDGIGDKKMFFAEFTDDEERVADGGMNFVDDDIPADERVIASSMENWENPNQVTVFEVNN